MSFRNKVWHDRVRQLGVVNVDGDIELTTSLGTFQTFADAYPAATEVYLVVEDTATGDWASGDAVYIPPTDNHITLFDIDETSGGSFAGGLVPGQNLIVFVDVNTKSMEDLDNAVGDNAGDIATLQTNSHAPGSDNQVAATVPVTPSGNLTSTDVQAALEELQADVDAGSDDQTASEVPFTPFGTVSSTNVQGAIEEHELDISQKANRAGDTITGAYTFSGGVGNQIMLGSSGDSAVSGNVNSLILDGGSAPNTLRVILDGTVTGSVMRTTDLDYEVQIDGHPFRDDIFPNVKYIDNQFADAANLTYSNVTSGLTATDAQAAIDELDGRLDAQETASANHVEKTGDTMTGQLTIDNTVVDAQLRVEGPVGRIEIKSDGFTEEAKLEYTNALNFGIFADATGNKVGFECLKIPNGADSMQITMDPGAPAYETLVVADNDIPNKKYVDDAIAGAAGTDDQTAGEVPLDSPYFTITGPSVQDAIEQLHDQKVAKAGDGMTGQLGMNFAGSVASPQITLGGPRVGLWAPGIASINLQTGDAGDTSETRVTLDRGGLLKMDDFGHLASITTYKALLDSNANGFVIAGWVTDQLVANNITYDNTSSGLTATDTQAAIDEVEARVDALEGNVYGTEFASAQDLTVSVSNADIFFNKLTIGPTAPVVGGTYEIEVNYKYSGDDTGEDFEARLQQDAVTLGTIHKQEIYESGGTFGSTGTDQRMPHSMRYLVTLAANDTPTFTLDYRSSKAGSDVSIMDALMTFKRVA